MGKPLAWPECLEVPDGTPFVWSETGTIGRFDQARTRIVWEDGQFTWLTDPLLHLVHMLDLPRKR